MSISDRWWMLWRGIFSSSERAPRGTAAGDPGRCLYLYLPFGEKLIPVGTLSQEGDRFVFEYDRRFRDRDDLPPISAFPDKSRVYRSPVLWPFFEVLLPPLERPDVAQIVKERKLDPTDVLALLETFGRRCLTTPYEFRAQRPTEILQKSGAP